MVSEIETFQQLSQGSQDCDARKEQTEASERETPSPPWSWAVRKNPLLELAELYASHWSPEHGLELLIRWE